MLFSSHLPHVFIGMEYLQLSNYSLAEEAFLSARALFADDPLLLNELGVASYNKKEWVNVPLKLTVPELIL